MEVQTRCSRCEINMTVLASEPLDAVLGPLCKDCADDWSDISSAFFSAYSATDNARMMVADLIHGLSVSRPRMAFDITVSLLRAERLKEMTRLSLESKFLNFADKQELIRDVQSFVSDPLNNTPELLSQFSSQLDAP